MHVVAAHHTQKHLCACLTQPFLGTVLRALGTKDIMKMVRHDPRSVLPFSVICLLGFSSGLVLGLFSSWSLYFEASLCIPDNEQIPFQDEILSQ